MITVVVKRNVFAEKSEVLLLPMGSVSELLKEADVHGLPIVSLQGIPIASEWWERVKPKAGSMLTVVCIPAGSADQLIPKDIQRMATQLLVNIGAIALQIGVGGPAGIIAGGALSIGGALAVNALIPLPPTPVEEQVYSLAGSRNQLRPGEAIPRLFGWQRIYPPLAARPYTVTRGADQWLHLLFAPGIGPLFFEDFKIGQTPLVYFKNVEMVVYDGDRNTGHSPTLHLYPQKVYQESFNLLLAKAPPFGAVDEWVWQFTQPDTDEIGVDFAFPRGLYRRTSDGGNAGTFVDFEIQYRLADTYESTEIGWRSTYPVNDETGEPIIDISQTALTAPQNLFDWLAGLLDDLQGAATSLANITAGDQRLSGIFRLWIVPILERISDGLDRWDPSNQDEEDTLTGVDAVISAILSTLDGYINDAVGNITEGVQQAIFDLIGASQIGAALIEVNGYLESGYSPVDLSHFPWWINLWIEGQGASYIFGGSPASNTFRVHTNEQGLHRFGHSWIVPRSGDSNAGRWEVRMRRITDDQPGDSAIVDEARWTAIRSISHRPPVNDPNIALIALRVKASDQLSGIIEQFNCIAESRIRRPADYTQMTTEPYEDWPRTNTRNPAWLYLAALLEYPTNPRPVDVSDAPLTRIDCQAIWDWAEACAAEEINTLPEGGWYGRVFNGVYNSETTLWRVLQDIASAGRATPHISAGKYSVVRDRFQTVPVQIFTPRNSWGFQSTRFYMKEAHAVRVSFVNADEDYTADERIVSIDGYADTLEGDYVAGVLTDPVSGLPIPTRVDRLQLFGVTYPQQAYSDGRYHLAVARLRPETYTLNVDVENLVASRGDLVRVVHFVTLWGLGAGRITAVEESGGVIVGVTLDEVVPFRDGQSYVMRLRASDGTIHERDLNNPGDLDLNQVTLANSVPVSGAGAVAVGDLVSFGIRGSDSVECLIKEVQPGPDFTARLVLIPHAPGVYTADSQPIPEWDSQITVPPELNRPAPVRPSIASTLSDETVLLRGMDGTLTSRIVLFFAPITHDAAGAVQPRTLEVQYALYTTGQRAWHSIPTLPAGAAEASIAPVEDGAVYFIRARHVGGAGQTSEWTELQHTVVGKTTPPPDVLLAITEGNRVRWTYPSPPPDLSGFVLRHRAGTGVLWETATPAHDGVLTSTIWDFAGLPPGTRTVLIRAIDVAGNLSTNAAAVTVNGGDPSLDNLLWSYDHKADAVSSYDGSASNPYGGPWPGEKTGCSIDGLNELAATEDATTFWKPDGSRFYDAQASAAFWRSIYDAMTYEWEWEAVTDYLPGVLRLDYEMQGEAYDVEYRIDTGALFWPEDMEDDLWPADMEESIWSGITGWMSWPGEVECQQATWEFRVTAAGGYTQGKLMDFIVILDVDDVFEDIEDVVIDSGGSRLALTKDYRVVKIVNVAVQYVPGYQTARSIVVHDKSVSLGPLVQCFDGANSPAAAVIDAHVRGF